MRWETRGRTRGGGGDKGKERRGGEGELVVVVNVVLLVHHCCSNMARGLWECLVITPFYFSFSFNFFFLEHRTGFYHREISGKVWIFFIFSLIIVHMVMGALYSPSPSFFFFYWFIYFTWKVPDLT